MNGTPDWQPFAYRDFYDVPHMLIVRHRGRWWLLDNQFDHSIDDYPNAYAVVELEESVAAEATSPARDGSARSWDRLKESGRLVGSIERRSLSLDRTRRLTIDVRILDAFAEDVPPVEGPSA